MTGSTRDRLGHRMSLALGINSDDATNVERTERD